MRGFIKAVLLALLIANSGAMAPVTALAQSQTLPGPRSASPNADAGALVPPGMSSSRTGGPVPGAPPPAAPATDPTGIGKAVLNAGPDPRVRLDGLSRDHAAIFGTEDEDEQALMDQERAVQTQRDQLQMLERLLNGKPGAADPFPPAMIPLNSGAPVHMPRLAPTPSGSQLNRGNSDARRNVDEMQRRVNELRRDADALRQGNR